MQITFSGLIVMSHDHDIRNHRLYGAKKKLFWMKSFITNNCIIARQKDYLTEFQVIVAQTETGGA